MPEQERDIQRYLDGIESQHKTKARFMATLTSILEKIDDVHGTMRTMPLAFYVHEAVGVQLDVVAELVGCNRKFPPVPIPGTNPTLDDDAFRTVILSKIIQNQWNGTNAGFHEIWQQTMQGVINAKYTDNQDMSVSVDVRGQLQPVITEMLLFGYIVPKPAGVQLNITVTSETEADANAGFPTSAGAKMLGAYASTRAAYPYLAEKNTGLESKAGSIAAVSAAALRMKYTDTGDKRGSSEIGSGSLPAANAAHLRIRYTQSGEQQDTDSIGTGAASVANAARIAVTIK